MMKKYFKERQLTAGLVALLLSGAASCTDLGAEDGLEDKAVPEQLPISEHTSALIGARNYDPARVVDFAFVPIDGTILPLQCDDCATTITTPFPIRFGGVDPGLTQLSIGSNGVLSFDVQISVFTNQPLPSQVADTVIAPFWDDLFPAAGGSVRSATVGDAPHRQLVIEYRDVPHFPGAGLGTFQVVFFEDSANIQFNYASVSDAAFNRGDSATVGVQVSGDTAQQFSFNTPSLSDNLSLLFANGGPTANAGPDQLTVPGRRVQLDGTASTDSNSTITAFAWTQIAGAPVQLDGANTATPSFIAPVSTDPLSFRLDVTDDRNQTASDTVTVRFDQPPVANAGADFRVATNLTGTLDGTASSDADSAIAAFHWTQIHGDPVVIANPDTARTTFIAPPRAQLLVFQLTVTDAFGLTSSATVIADVFFNLAPLVSAGQDRVVHPGQLVVADGTGSTDPDGQIVSFAWTTVLCVSVDGPCSVALDNDHTATPQFVAPGASALIVLRLDVVDNAGATASDTVTFAVIRQPPVATITAATACVQDGETVTLDGSRSSDPDGSIVAFAWTQLSGPPVTLNNATGPVASFTSPAQGTLVFALQVTDNDGEVATSQVTIPVDPLPVARAIASAVVAVAGTTVTLDGSASTDAAAVFWHQTAGTTVFLSNPNALTTTFVAPAPQRAFEIATFELIVQDACGGRSTTTVSVVIVPAH
jgi:hypothetical protein